MRNCDIVFHGCHYTGGKAKEYFVCDTNYLSRYFATSNRNILRWIKEKKFNPADMESIVLFKKRRDSSLKSGEETTT